MKGARSILHVDLQPFFVSVERSRDASLRERPVIVAGRDDLSLVAAVSREAREAGARVGQPASVARRLCPDAAVVPGDLEAYAQVSDEVTAILLAASRRVERPSVDEAYVDLTREGGGASPVPTAEGIKDDLQRRLGLDAALGLASTRLAARVASTWARPRGLLVVLPGYEAAFVGRQPVAFLEDLPPHLEHALEEAGIRTLGELAEADPQTLTAFVGAHAADRLRAAAAGRNEEPIAPAAPPAWIQEESLIRDRRTDREGLLDVVEGLAVRASRRLRPFDVAAGTVTVEFRRGQGSVRRDDHFDPGVADEDTARQVARALAEPLADAAAGVRSVQVRLSRLARRGSAQGSLFPALAARVR
jgi:DNA polymerase IV